MTDWTLVLGVLTTTGSNLAIPVVVYLDWSLATFVGVVRPLLGSQFKHIFVPIWLLVDSTRPEHNISNRPTPLLSNSFHCPHKAIQCIGQWSMLEWIGFWVYSAFHILQAESGQDISTGAVQPTLPRSSNASELVLGVLLVPLNRSSYYTFCSSPSDNIFHFYLMMGYYSMTLNGMLNLLTPSIYLPKSSNASDIGSECTAGSNPAGFINCGSECVSFSNLHFAL
ncbi:hypothetical protein BDQ17DRAFT_886206 [Cyathus striatus]|nr:hypothetical protein BDQ17DRAFT_886206 [Cyathus striatus]